MRYSSSVRHELLIELIFTACACRDEWSAGRLVLHCSPTRRSSDLGVEGGRDPAPVENRGDRLGGRAGRLDSRQEQGDRESTRLNSSHPSSSYAVFCLKKKKRELARDEIGGMAGMQSGFCTTYC